MTICIFPKCEDQQVKEVWCEKHWGLFPHFCEYHGCDSKSLYDDEPYCFTHSPDSGSSVKGYSAYKNFLASLSEHPSNNGG
jgi:hypothetical protein